LVIRACSSLLSCCSSRNGGCFFVATAPAVMNFVLGVLHFACFLALGLVFGVCNIMLRFLVFWGCFLASGLGFRVCVTGYVFVCGIVFGFQGMWCCMWYCVWVSGGVTSCVFFRVCYGMWHVASGLGFGVLGVFFCNFLLHLWVLVFWGCFFVFWLWAWFSGFF